MPSVLSLPNRTTSYVLSTHRDSQRWRAFWGWGDSSAKHEAAHSSEKPSITHEPYPGLTGKGQKGGNWTGRGEVRSSRLHSLLRMCPSLKSHPTLCLALLSLPRSYLPSAAAKCVLNKGRLKPSGILEATLQH